MHRHIGLTAIGVQNGILKNSGRYFPCYTTKPPNTNPTRLLSLPTATLIFFAQTMRRSQPKINVQQMTCHVSVISYVLNADSGR